MGRPAALADADDLAGWPAAARSQRRAIPWLDEAGRRARARLDAARLELVVGHGDWHTGNVHWDGETLHAVHDWDSVVCAPEAAIAGAAATGFAETEVTPGATIEQAEAFLQAYGRSWTAEEREVAWAAGLWLLAFNAKVELLRGRLDRTVPHLRRELDERLRLAGA
jgi:Ser/Thr protein kinase RdoA (MazF antagonist)